MRDLPRSNRYVTMSAPGKSMIESLERRVLMTTVVNTLVNFSFDGYGAAGQMYQDGSGNLFAVATAGSGTGGGDSSGALIEYSPGGSVTDLIGFPQSDIPEAGLVSDGAGNFYGTYGGNKVWEYSTGSGTLNLFAGSFPTTDTTPGTGMFGTLFRDPSGNIFGTTKAGGVDGDGTVWELQSGSTTITDLADFTGDNGTTPMGGVVEDSAGDLFGTTNTSSDANDAEGVLWELPATMHTITKLANVGVVDAGLVTDGQGHYYGTSANGGEGSGDIYEWDASDGTSVKVLAVLDGADGSTPTSELVRDSAGDLFGTATAGGNGGYGSVFELPSGASVVRPVSYFSTDPSPSNSSLYDTIYPSSPLVLDSSGDLFGLGNDTGAPDATQFLTGGLYEVPASTISQSVPQLVFATQPNLANPYAIPAFTVHIEDSSGNVITSDNSAVTIGLGPSDQGILQGTTTVNATAGVAVFSSLNIESPDLESPPSGTFTFQLTDDIDQPTLSAAETIGANGGGGGGTTTSSTLSPVVLKTTLPAAAVQGSTTHGRATVAITNTGAGKYSELLTTEVVADLNGVDTVLGTYSHIQKINAGATRDVSVTIKPLPASLDGTYTLLAETIDSTATTVATTGPTLQVATAYVAFQELSMTTNLPANSISGGKTSAKATIVLTNTGNVPSTGLTTIALYASPDGTVANGTPIRTVTESLPIKPGQTKKAPVPLKSLPAVADGNYYIVAQLVDPKGNITSVSTVGTVGLAAPYVQLVPAFSPLTTDLHGVFKATLTITNNGNTAPVGASQLTYFVSPDGGLSDATQVSSVPISLPLKPAAHRIIHIHYTDAALAGLETSGQYLIAEVTDPQGDSEYSSVLLPG